jgi:hypothetical protein
VSVKSFGEIILTGFLVLGGFLGMRSGWAQELPAEDTSAKGQRVSQSIVTFGADWAQASELVWQVETVASAGDVGAYTALALNAEGYAHISYHDVTNDNLMYAYQDVSGWHTETVDSARQVGEYGSLALDGSGYGHVSYYDSKYVLLKHAYKDGSGWHIYPPEMIDEGVGSYTSIALDGSDYPHISYYDETSYHLKYAYEDGAGWHTETVDNSAYVGWYTALALDGGGYVHISYYDATQGDLKYAYQDYSGWSIETVDSAGNVGVETSLALDASGNPHVSYWDWDNGNLKYAYKDGSGWHIETVDDGDAGNVGRYSAIALDGDGYAHISYYDFDDGDLKYAYKDGSGWHTETVDSSGNVGLDTSLALDGDGAPRISYYDYGNGDLKYAMGRWVSGPSADVPLDLQRRAAGFLEELRNSGLAPDWDSTAEVGTSVRPLYRPDLVEIAYYEFPVTISGGETSGFVILSTADHDYPVAHWSSSGEPPTQALAQAALDEGEVAVKFYKLDALAYAAENGSGEIVASLGDMPPKIVGLDPTWRDDPPENTAATWVPDEISGTLTITGPTAPSSLQFSAWDSWDDLKTGYGGTYDVLLDVLESEASEDWATEDNIERQGAVLYEGDVYQMALLGEHGVAYFDGAGVDYVAYKVIERPGSTPLLQITVLDALPGQSLSLTVTVEYTNGVTETVNFMIVAPVANSQVFLPYVARSSSGQIARTMRDAEGGRDTCPAGYTCAWAGDQWDQRWYNQIPPWTSPWNWRQCYSGCGATAWAMLFGWADHQAEQGHVQWWPHWGIYRQNGGYGDNADAPFLMDDGVRNMITEIRGYIGTWCDPTPSSENGATLPGDMFQAYRYLYGRAAVRVLTHYNYAGALSQYLGGVGSVEGYAINSILYRHTPVIIGTGFLNHYAVAYGYAERPRKTCTLLGWPCWTDYQRYFQVNQGWTTQWQVGEATYYIPSKGWVSTRTWFVGEIYP